MEEKNIFHKVYQKVDQYLTIAELIFLAIITLLLILERFLEVSLLSFSFYALVLLSVLYYLKAIGDYTQGFDWKKFMNKIPFIGPSMIALGLAFWVKDMNSLAQLIALGIPFSLFGTVVYFLDKENKTNEKYRFLLFTVFGIALTVF